MLNLQSKKKIFLEKGDKVHIIAPSSKCSTDDLTKSVEYIRYMGLLPYISENICSNEDPFYSNSDVFRAKDLVKALTSDSELVWCIRGGSGAIRLIPYLDRLLPDNLPEKLFIGYSDITVLHSYLQCRYGWTATIHGPMLGQIVSGHYDHDEGSVSELISLVFGDNDNITLKGIKEIEVEGKQKFTGEILYSKVVGGNMTLLESSIGTDWQISTKNAILFLEDVDDLARKMERILDHMKLVHMFDEVRAVIFGDFTNYDDDLLVSVVKERFAANIDAPVFSVVGVGHGPVNHPLPLNTSANLRFDSSINECVLQIENCHI